MSSPCKKAGALVALLLVAVLGTSTGMVRAGSLASSAINDPIYTVFPQPWQQIDAPAAWNVSQCAGITVAVVDTGVSPVGNLSSALLPGWNFIASNDNAADDNGHGTAVASVVTAMCGQAKILPIKTGRANGGTNCQLVAQGITYGASHGAKVINVSEGNGPGSPSCQVLNDAVASATASGLLVVLGAGNSGSSDVAMNRWASDNPEGIRVAGVQLNNTPNPFSNHGSWTDIGAPYSLQAQGADGALGRFSGTSFAAPMVSGVAAMLFSYSPGLSPEQVKYFVTKGGTATSGLDVACGCVLNAFGSLVAAGYDAPVQKTATTLPPTVGVKYSLQVNYNVARGAVVYHPATINRRYWVGTAVWLAAKPKKGWLFSNWIGASPGCTDRPNCTIKMNQAKVITAVFVRTKK